MPLPRYCYYVALICLCTVVAAEPMLPYGFTKAPKFVVDLDKAPEHRWDGAIDLVVSLYGWNVTFESILKKHIKRLEFLPEALCEKIFANLKQKYPARVGELVGLTRQLRHAALKAGSALGNITDARAVIFTYYYEFGDINIKKNPIEGSGAQDRSCSGILSLPRNTSETTIHGRNMDEAPIDGRYVTLDITVVRGGNYLYNMFDWTWFTAGTFTGSRLGHVTLEENWREHSFLSFETILARLLENETVPISFMFRNILEAGMTFDEALHYLNTSQFAAPFYAIMSGPNRVGAVVTGFFNNTDNRVAMLNDASPTPYLVQTNYDRWLPDPMSDPRRTVAEQHLALVGPYRSGTELGVWMAASTYPVHNTGTMYTVLLSVDHEPEGYVRVPMKPEPGRRQ